MMIDDARASPFIANNEHFGSFRFCVAKSKHSGEEIALACFDEEYLEESMSWVWKDTLVCVVSIISAVFLIATLAVYVMLPELRELQDKAMMAAVTTLVVSYTVLSIQHLRPVMDDDHIICVTLGTFAIFKAVI